MTDSVARLTSALAGRYAIERELGQGGMATVYLAHDVRHDRKVALKVLRPELSAILGGERFLAEIRTTANLQHPHILSLFDSGDADGTVFYVMPYVEGESLRDRLTRAKQLPVEEAVRIAREVADALQYAHERGIVHRDIKPENILLHGGHALVADFGIALAASRSEGGTRMTETGMSLGTPHYMSPEQAMGEREITPKADIYALGCVLYEMLTAEPPFTGATAQAIIARVMTEEPRPLTTQRRTIPPHVEAAVRTALEKLPADRFANAAEFAAALANPAYTARTGLAGAAPAARSASTWRSRAAIPLAVIALGSLGLATWALTRPEPPPHPVARFTVLLPGTRLGISSAPVLSPDGSRILLVAVDSLGRALLALRSLDQDVALPIAGTEGIAAAGVFSPDGQSIAYRHGGKLRRVSLAGGAPQTLADWLEPSAGLTWTDRDEIVYGRGDTLLRVPAAGGTPVVVAGPDSSSGTLRFVSPHALPGGRSMIATRWMATGTQLVAIELSTGTVRNLGMAGMTPWFVDAGRMMYTDPAGTLLSVPFDPRRAEITGPAEPIAENVNILFGVFARASASRTGAIAYLTGAAQRGRELVVVSREGRAEPLAAPPALYRFPRFSPDGRRFAVGTTLFGRATMGDLWIWDFGSRRLTRLTADSNNWQPEWTPDGTALIYPHGALSGNELRRISADGSSDPQPFFTRRPAVLVESRLLPGGLLLFREDVLDPAAGTRNILVAPVDSPAAARPLAATAFNERGIAVTLDGRWLAFTSNLSGSDEIYIRRLDEGSPRWRVSTRGGTEPRWGPGNRELFFRLGDSVYVVAIALGGEPRLGEPRALFGGQYVASPHEPLYDVSPDGQRFLMVRELGLASPTASVHIVLHAFDQRRK
jgi:serine/threonine-protein kinase